MEGFRLERKSVGNREWISAEIEKEKSSLVVWLVGF